MKVGAGSITPRATYGLVVPAARLEKTTCKSWWVVKAEYCRLNRSVLAQKEEEIQIEENYIEEQKEESVIVEQKQQKAVDLSYSVAKKNYATCSLLAERSIRTCR